MSSQIKDKNSKSIKEGDEVWTPMRGGKHQGKVDNIAKTEEEANEAGVKNPPKVSCAIMARAGCLCADVLNSHRFNSPINTAIMLRTTQGLCSMPRKNSQFSWTPAVKNDLKGKEG